MLLTNFASEDISFLCCNNFLLNKYIISSSGSGSIDFFMYVHVLQKNRSILSTVTVSLV